MSFTRRRNAQLLLDRVAAAYKEWEGEIPHAHYCDKDDFVTHPEDHVPICTCGAEELRACLDGLLR